jgi:Sortilin, neurotensin receptor 3, C-terminal
VLQPSQCRAQDKAFVQHCQCPWQNLHCSTGSAQRRQDTCHDPRVQACDCKKEDFYCEYGYEKKIGSNSECEPMIGGDAAPVCTAIAVEAYKPSASHLRLAHGETCPNVGMFIKDTDGNVRAPPRLVQACCACAEADCVAQCCQNV